MVMTGDEDLGSQMADMAIESMYSRVARLVIRLGRCGGNLIFHGNEKRCSFV